MHEIIKTDNPEIVIERTFIDKSINLREICEERTMRNVNLVKYHQEKADLELVENNPLLSALISNRLLELDDLIRFDEQRIEEISLIITECQSQ